MSAPGKEALPLPVGPLLQVDRGKCCLLKGYVIIDKFFYLRSFVFEFLHGLVNSLQVNRLMTADDEPSAEIAVLLLGPVASWVPLVAFVISEGNPEDQKNSIGNHSPHKETVL